MRTVTTYRETITITTDDDGARTITRSHDADTVSEYRFTDLDPEAQQRAIRDAISEEDASAYEWGSHTYFATEEIIDAARDLEKSQPIDIAQDQGCSWYGTARGTWWHHAADWQAVTEATDTGICYSMDICDKWNEYAARIIVLQEGHEEATGEAYRLEEEADRLDDARHYDDMPDAMRDALRITVEGLRAAAYEYERISERIEDAAEELTEEAARAVGSVIDGLIESEAEYYTSEDFWREWLADSDDRYTREGARI